MWLQCAMWPICRLITVAPAICSGNAPIHTDCALANHSILSSGGAAFAPYPIERHLAETSKMAAKNPNQAFEQMCLFFSNLLGRLSQKTERLYGLCSFVPCRWHWPIPVLFFLSFSVCSACVMWLVVSLSHYMQMLFASSAVLMFQNQESSETRYFFISDFVW